MRHLCLTIDPEEGSGIDVWKELYGSVCPRGKLAELIDDAELFLHYGDLRQLDNTIENQNIILRVSVMEIPIVSVIDSHGVYNLILRTES